MENTSRTKNILKAAVAIALMGIWFNAMVKYEAKEDASIEPTKQERVFANNFMTATQKTNLISLMVEHKLTSLEFYHYSDRYGDNMRVSMNGLDGQREHAFQNKDETQFLDSILPINFDSFGRNRSLKIQLKSDNNGQLYLTFTNTSLLDNSVNFQNLNNVLKNPEFERHYIQDFNQMLSSIKF